MKYIKTYESIGEYNVYPGVKIDFPENHYWIIYGVKENVVGILKQILRDRNNKDLINNLLQRIINGLEYYIWNNKNRSSIGIYFCYSNTNVLFSTFNTEKEKEELIQKYQNFKDGGEIKRDKNGYIVVDKLTQIMKKYNL